MVFRKTARLICGLMLLGIASSGNSQDTNNASVPGLEDTNLKVLETDILQNVAGFKGGLLDAEVIEIIDTDDGQSQEINIVVPVDPAEVDRVQVLSPSGQPIKLKRPPQISMDHENNEVGIIVTLPKNKKLGFKLKLIDVPDE